MHISRSVFIKLLLYIVPAAAISWWFLYVENALVGGIGGGAYNENGIAYALTLVAWAMGYTVAMLIAGIIGHKNAALLKENLLFCGLGFLAVVSSVVYLGSYLD